MLNLFFAEHDYQVEDFLKYYSKNHVKWIALGPSAMHSLLQKGIPYSTPEDYCSLEEVEKECIRQFVQLSNICHKIDDILLEQNPFLAKWGIRPFFFHLWQFSQLLDGLVCRKLQIKKILENFPDAHVYIHLAPPQNWSLSGIGFSQSETLWGRLMRLPGWNIPVHILIDPSNQNEDKIFHFFYFKQQIKNSIKYFITIFPIFRSLVQSFRLGWKTNLFNVLKKDEGNKSILILNGVYEWSSILPEFIDAGHPVYFISGLDLHQRSSAFLEVKNSSKLAESLWEEFINTFDHSSSINCLELIRDRFNYIIDQAPLDAQNIVNRFERFVSGKNISILLTAVNTDFCSYIIKQFCREKEIKVLSWQHGAEWYDKRITQRNDLLNLISCDKMLVYGDSVKFAYESSPVIKAETCEVRSVGMASLDKLKEYQQFNHSKNEIKILWVLGAYYGNGWYCGFTPPYNDRIYYHEQCVIINNIIKLINKNKKILLTIKLSSNTNPPWVKDIKKTDRIKIIRSKPKFVELLDNHDVVIIDTPTTILLQAISTKLPVFVLLSVIRWSDNAINILKRRAVCVNNAEYLIDKLKNYLENNQYDCDIQNRDFLKYYGTHLDDGKSNVRAKTIVEEILFMEEDC